MAVKPIIITFFQCKMMEEEMRIRTWLEKLSEVAKEYPGRTIENIIDNLKARLRVLESIKK